MQKSVKPLKLNLGCGTRYLDGYINCDIAGTVKTDMEVDLNRMPYPFADSSITEVLLDNVLEHLENVPRVMEEIYRLLVPTGVAKIYVPYGKSDWAMQDPTHKHYFTERSMDFFCEGNAYSFYADAKFQLVKTTLFCESDSLRAKLRNYLPFRSTLKYFLFNMYDGIYFELKAHK